MDAVLIGDSFTHGACVARTDHFSQRLREVMPRVLNLGVSGSGPLTELAILREYAAEKTPRHVFWVYYEGNDRYDVSVENRHPVLSRYRDDPAFRQHLLQYQDGIDAGLAAWVDSALSDPPQPQAISLSQRIRLSMALSTLRQVAGIAVPMPSREPAALNIPTILATAVSEVRAWGGTFHLVYLPQYARYQSRIGSGTRGRNDVLSTADSLGVDVIDLVPVFDRLTDPQSMWTGPGGHYAVAGYRLVGEAVLGAIHHP